MRSRSTCSLASSSEEKAHRGDAPSGLAFFSLRGTPQFLGSLAETDADLGDGLFNLQPVVSRERGKAREHASPWTSATRAGREPR
jgi:hypothetical protein